MKYFVVSDIHSFFTPFIMALREASFDETNPNHLLVICGDMFDRGTESLELIKYIYHLISIDKVILIRGNHEDLLENVLSTWQPQMHDYANGTVQTITDIGATEWEDDFFSACIKTKKILKKMFQHLRNFYETKNYIFTHGWIPSGEEWRDAPNSEWYKARWVNGMFAAANGHIIPEKTVICGHWHCSYGHSKDTNGEIPEFGNGAVFDPYYSDGIIAIDACTAASGKVNVIKIEDEDL